MSSEQCVNGPTKEWAIVFLAGEYDLVNASQLANTITTAAQNEVAGVVADFTYVDFIDVSGVRALEAAYRRLSMTGCALKVRAAPPLLASMLNIFQLTALLEHPGDKNYNGSGTCQ